MKTGNLFLPGISWLKGGCKYCSSFACLFDRYPTATSISTPSYFWYCVVPLPTLPHSFLPTSIITTGTFDHVKVKLHPLETTSCLSLKPLISSAMHSHPPFHRNSAQLTQTGTDIGARATAVGWSVISGVPDQIAPFTVCMKSHRQRQKEGQNVWGVR